MKKRAEKVSQKLIFYKQRMKANLCMLLVSARASGNNDDPNSFLQVKIEDLKHSKKAVSLHKIAARRSRLLTETRLHIVAGFQSLGGPLSARKMVVKYSSGRLHAATARDSMSNLSKPLKLGRPML